MGQDGKDEVMVCETGASGCSEATVEIKIKTLDSQTYTLRVDKRVPVPALKEQIATVTGVLSEQQRLICRGKVLKDDQLLSAYHVEDGHTLHLVVRQPIPLLSESSDTPAADLASSAVDSHGSQRARVVMGSFNIADQEDGVFSDLNQIISAVLGSIGITNSEGGGIEVVDNMGSLSEGLSRQSGSSTAGDSVRGQSGQENAANHFTNVWNPMQPPVIPDSLTTLSEYLNNLRREFMANGVNENASQASGDIRSNVQEPNVAPRRSGLPGPTQLAEVLQLTRQLLVSEVAECLSSLSRQVEDHVNVTDPSDRTRRQLTVLQSGVLLESLGASLLELGRTTMMLRLGQTADEAVVNAGPAVFISPSGPSPIMVQPHPSRLGISNFSAAPTGNTQPNSQSGGSRGSGPRNIEIRIRTGSWMPSSGVNQRGSAAPQPTGQTNSAASSVTNSITSLRGISDTTRSPVALVIPVVGRYQQSSGGPDAAQQQNTAFPGRQVDNNVGTEMPNGRGLSELRNRINQLLRPVGVNPGDLDSQNTADSSAIPANPNETSVNTVQETAPPTSDEGNLVASMLQQIMPLISQNLDSSSTVGTAAEMENSNSRQASLTQERGSGSSRQSEQASPPDAKRQKRE